MDQNMSYDYDPIYQQLTPLQLSDTASCDTSRYEGCRGNTDVTHINVDDVLSKLQTLSQNDVIDGILNPSLSTLNHEHLQQLFVLYRNFPLTVFIGYLKRAYAECDVKMDAVRVDLFNLVKQREDSPYVNNDLKRRSKRNGGQLTDRLCRDIHTLLAILDGEEIQHTDLKEMLSKRAPSRMSSVSSSRPEASQTPQRSAAPASEIKLLQESIGQLKADILLIKQSACAVTSERSEQIKTLKETVSGIKCDFSKLEACVRNSLSEIVLCLQRVESERVSGVVSLKNEVKALHENVRSVEDGLYIAMKGVNGRLESLSRVVSNQSRRRRGDAIDTSKRRALSGPVGYNGISVPKTQTERLETDRGLITEGYDV